MGVGIIGTGSYVPSRVVRNADLVAWGVDTSADWILSRTGIRERRWAEPHQSTSDLAVLAIKAALDAAGVQPKEVALIVCATSSPDFAVPATAGIIAGKLGLDRGGFDINAACSGFVHALSAGFALCEQIGGVVVVVGADVYSRFLDPRGRDSAVFFGDGAGAVVLAQTSGRCWLRACISGSDGSNYDKILLPGPGVPVAARSTYPTWLTMNGKAVWEFATSRVPNLVHAVSERAGIEVGDLQLIIPHQSNARMIANFRDQLGVDASRFMINVEHYGNTAAASVGIALHESFVEGRLSSGGYCALVGFGAGLSWAAACIQIGAATN